MTEKSGFMQQVWRRLLGKEKEEATILQENSLQSSEIAITSPTDKDKTVAIRNNPHLFQIGFDFGTSYSKCIYRDLMTDKAWVHLPTGMEDQELPFLIPGTLLLQNGNLEHVKDTSVEYYKNGLNHIKLALEKVALKEWKDTYLEPFTRAIGKPTTKRFGDLVQACGVYFLAGAFNDVLNDLKKRFPDFGLHPQDYVLVNLAIPVADADRPEVNSLYKQVLYDAWSLKEELGGYPKVSPSEVAALISQCRVKQSPEFKETCFIYPEVSANVQSFVRSRLSMPGTYLFTDTGAGSVDQCVFIFFKINGVEKLTYLSASVLPMGSSRIEQIAASSAGNLDYDHLELLRKMKESGETTPELSWAQYKIENDLTDKTLNTLAWAKGKLIVKQQLYDIRLIFGGGGHCVRPYETGVRQSFSSGLFPQGIEPDTVGMPIPNDLELDEQRSRWMRRLSVAYGLSFLKDDLAKFYYPSDVDYPEPDEIWDPQRKLPEAPTKDVI